FYFSSPNRELKARQYSTARNVLISRAALGVYIYHTSPVYHLLRESRIRCGTKRREISHLAVCFVRVGCTKRCVSRGCGTS
ncbi:hypothetical protein TSAR_007081, partial [Trichomalopsis sarcophagae]